MTAEGEKELEKLYLYTEAMYQLGRFGKIIESYDMLQFIKIMDFKDSEVSIIRDNIVHFHYMNTIKFLEQEGYD